MKKDQRFKYIFFFCASAFCTNALAQSAPLANNVPANAAATAALTPTAAIPPDTNLQALPAATATQIPTPTPQIPALSNGPTPNTIPDENPADDAAVVQMAREQAFNQLALNTLPMTSDQIQKLKSLFADSQRAATAYPGGAPPKPVASTQLVSLSPGSTPPIIRLAQGYVTSVVFLDSTGAPWPLASYDIGNPSAFNVQWDHVGNVLMIQSSALYTAGNLVVQLKGLNTPVSITLIPGQPIVDYRIDMRVPGAGPNAKPGAQNALPQAADNVLLNVLDGVPPANSKTLTVQPGSSSLAWLVGDQIYLRTPLTLLSPAWVATMASADGTNAYQIPKAPLILVSDANGKIFNLRIEGY